MSVPGRGWTFADGSIIATRAFGIMGPFAAGDIVDRLEVFINNAAPTGIQFGASVGGSSDATAAAYSAGAGIIDRGEGTGTGPPVVIFPTLPAGLIRFIVAVGRVMSVGSNYMVLSMESTVAAVNTGWLVTCFVRRANKGAGVGPA